MGAMSATEPEYVPTWTLADRCRKARLHGGFESQDELAEAIPCDRNTISNYESGKTRRPTKAVLNRWAMVCGVSARWLATGDGPDTTSDQGKPPIGGNVNRPGRHVRLAA